MATNLTPEATLGYDNPTGIAPYLATSNCWYAWHIGRWLNQTHRTAPRDVRPSRGDTFHVNGMRVKITLAKAMVQIERIA